MKRVFWVFFPLIFAQTISAQQSNPLISKADSASQMRWIDSVFNSLSLRERIAQLFMVAAYSNKDDSHVMEISQLVSKQGIGGLIFFQGGPVRQARQTNYYQSLAKVPLLIGIDAEWGLGMRLDSTISYPRQMALGATNDTLLTYQMAADIAHQFKRMGIHINFAPVIDINSNPLNPVIGSRAFGQDMEMVTRHGMAYTKGLQENGILACAKHFPGHGDTYDDSHLTLPLVPHSANRIDSIELYPFKKLFAAGVASVMVAHLKIPSLEPDTLLPASLSARIVGQKLFGELGFNGLAFTDAMNMKGVADFYNPVDANIRSLMAGNDILLFPSEIENTIKKVEQLIKSEQIPEELINIKCKKVLMAKYLVGLNKYRPINVDRLYNDLNSPYSQVLRRKIIRNAITVIHNANNILPLRGLDTLRIAYIEIGESKGDAFREQLELYTAVHTFSINPEAEQAEYDTLLTNLEPYNLIIVGYHTIESKAAKGFGVSQQSSNFLFDLSFRKKVILNLFGNPYSISRFANPLAFAAIIVSYDNSTDSQNLTAQTIFGGIPFSGRLSVTASDLFGINTGYASNQRIRLGYSIPEELGIGSEQLSEVDSLAMEIIRTGAAPGMQILAAKDGVVFYNKAFGKPTYVSEYGNDIRMLYDIASVTKVAATLPPIMNLYNRGVLSFDSKLGQFIDLRNFPDKSKLLLGDILRHQSGLQAWIPFYMNTLISLEPNIPLWTETFSQTHPYKYNGKRYASRFAYPSPKFYRTDSISNFPNNVAYRIYSLASINDSIYRWINQSPISDAGKYRYSDLGFLYLQKVIETVEQKRLDKVVEPLYSKLGMNYTCFNPLLRFDTERIAPTEHDPVFRKQLIWGHVHDPAAAMLGGVAGHAGLFANANDLAKLMQLYLNDGEYGGERFFAPSTVKSFANPATTNGNRRAYGFDKPNASGSSPAGTMASPESFGHTGFTGTMVWADPQNGLVFIFLSNRVHPDAENTKLSAMNYRTRIHDVFYRAIQSISKPSGQ